MWGDLRGLEGGELDQDVIYERRIYFQLRRGSKNQKGQKAFHHGQPSSVKGGQPEREKQIKELGNNSSKS